MARGRRARPLRMLGLMVTLAIIGAIVFFQMNANKEFIFLDWYPALLADRFRYYLYSDFVLSSKLPTPSMEACSTRLPGAKPSQNAQDGATF